MNNNSFGNSILDQNPGSLSLPTWMTGSGSAADSSSEAAASSSSASDIISTLLESIGTTQTSQATPTVESILANITPEQVLPSSVSPWQDLLRSKDNKFGTISYVSRPSPGGYTKW